MNEPKGTKKDEREEGRKREREGGERIRFWKKAKRGREKEEDRETEIKRKLEKIDNSWEEVIDVCLLYASEWVLTANLQPPGTNLSKSTEDCTHA